ncbi:hypothetical protein GCM10022221_01880 [Actinocorallia aurea]
MAWTIGNTRQGYWCGRRVTIHLQRGCPVLQGGGKRGASPHRLTDVSLLCKVFFVRSAFKCRAYPDPEQEAVLNRTFGCVRLVWNQTLAERHARYHGEGKTTSTGRPTRPSRC